ncbi:MAG TPA: hypothetical protein PKD52_02280 [Clostridiales bacterium]|nr:hypothetical protein [Clostridiales bacterium]
MSDQRLFLLITIVNRGNGTKVMERYKEQGVSFHVLSHGYGSADSELLEILGLGETEKDVILSIGNDVETETVMTGWRENKKIQDQGKGIVFTVPLSAIVGQQVLSYLTERAVQ